ncbi:MAG: 5'-3' exonuclease, partial [Aggregatilineales bacterium]
MSERPVLFLIDGHAVAYRQFYAFANARNGSFMTAAGEPTGGTYGFTRLLLEILQTEKPKYLAVSFDRGLSGRDTLFEDYKANRDAMPDDLIPQLQRIEQIVRAFNIPVLALDGYEADDVIGTITKQADPAGVDVRIITGDRDILQLLSPSVRVQLPQYKKSADMIYDIVAFTKKYDGLTPDQLVDLKALMGDSSDNIPGVKGIGQKTGTKLLLEYGSLDEIYANLDKIKGSVNRK